MAEIELPNPEELRELKEKHFSRRVALMTAVYAVLLAITSLGGNNATKDMMLAQQQQPGVLETIEPPSLAPPKHMIAKSFG